MTKSDLPDLRRLAARGRITYSEHAFIQMLDRGISREDIKNILSSPTNQLIEVQPPSDEEGKRHKDERALVSDPEYKQGEDGIVVILVIQFNPYPELRIVTAMYVWEERWVQRPGEDPWLVRSR